MYPQRSYLICTTPRSGSTFLCELLKQSQLAGRPNEYFVKRHYLEWGFNHFGVSNFFDYYQKILETTTTENGVFGVKLIGGDDFNEFIETARQLPAYRSQNIPIRELLDQIFPNAQYIWLIRRNKLRQAISWLKAEQSGIWHTFLKLKEVPQEPEFKFEALNRKIHTIVMQEVGWQEFFTEAGIVPLTLVYEDFSQFPEETVRRILDYLDIPIPPGWTLGECGRTKKLADSKSDMWVQLYYDHITNKQ